MLKVQPLPHATGDQEKMICKPGFINFADNTSDMLTPRADNLIT